MACGVLFVPSGGFDFRRFLPGSQRSAKPDELEQDTPTTGARHFPRPIAERDAAPTCLVSPISLAVVEEKRAPVAEPLATPKPLGGRRREPSYVWRSQRSRAGIFDVRF
jgi:hypothetical protein